MSILPSFLRLARTTLLATAVAPAWAGTGWTTVAPIGTDHPVTVFYPTAAPDRSQSFGLLSIPLAKDGEPITGNGRLIVISHGSGGGPFVHADLARTLVAGGFVVAAPQHRGDSFGDDATPGPTSWKLRPTEVSHAIDAVARDPRFADLLTFDRVGVYGMSAGGHTALSMAGGAWSPGNFKRHCEAHIAEDFYTCVGLAARQTGGLLDGLNRQIALAVLRLCFDDDTPQVHADARVAVVVAAVPAAADFDMQTLSSPRVPLGIVSAGRDAWLVPRFHAGRLLATCKTCEVVADLPTAGHGAMLSPHPPGLTGLAADLLNDPPSFDRSTLPAVDRRITAFFAKHLLAP